MDIIQITVHPKGSSARAYWKCPPLCKVNLLPLLVLNKQHCCRYLCGREGATSVTRGIPTSLGDADLRATPLHFSHSKAQGSWIPQVLVGTEVEEVVIHHTSAQGQSLNQSTLNTHSLPEIVLLKKALCKQLLCTSSFPFIYVTPNFTRHNKLFNYEQRNYNNF